MLLRKFIARRLAEYYAQPSHAVVGSIPPQTSFPFPSLLGAWHWRWLYSMTYERQNGQWLTPVELFKPFYSYTLASFIAEASASAPSSSSACPPGLHVVELGGGRGTNAALILSRLRSDYPALYEKITYTIFDASPTLHELQKQELHAHGHVDDKVEFVLRDMTDVAEGVGDFLSSSPDLRPTIVIACELLDNLAHDKVTRCRRTRALQQAEVIENASSVEGTECREVFEPLTDPLLAELIEDAPSFVSGTGRRPIWIPTVACGVIRRLYEERPNASMILADFDWLPALDLEERSIVRRASVLADGEPIITDMDDVDHVCYATAPRRCDILFPTDYLRLADYVRKRAKGLAQVRVTKQADFLLEYGRDHVDATRGWIGGFTPLLEDFSNYSILAATAMEEGDDGGPKKVLRR